MNRLIGIVLILSAWCVSLYAAGTETFVLGTYNLRCLTDIDAKRGDQWDARKQYAAGLIKFHGFDIFGTQELVKTQIDDLLRMAPEYSYVGAGRDDGKEKGEYVAIFYRPDKFELIDSGNFWLGEDETKPVKGWDASYIRICTWAQFRIKNSNFKFVYFNVHLDNDGEQARRESANKIMAKMNSLSPSLPAIMAGDFNVTENSEVYRVLSSSGKLFDARKTAGFIYCNNSSYNDFNPAGTNEGVLDHIFLSRDFNVKKYGLLTDVYRSVDADGAAKARTPSDHFPIMLILEVK